MIEVKVVSPYGGTECLVSVNFETGMVVGLFQPVSEVVPQEDDKDNKEEKENGN